MCTKLFSFVLLVTLAFNANCREYIKEKPAFVQTCFLKDPDFNACYRKNFELLVENWGSGVPGFAEEGQVDPLFIKKLRIQHNELKIEVRNVSIRGLSGTKLTNIKLDQNNLSLLLNATIPRIRIDGTYKTKGNVLLLPVNTHGTMWMEIENIDISLHFQSDLVDEDGLTFANLKSVNTHIHHIGEFRVNLGNLFNGNKQLEESTHSLINDHWRDYFDIFRPTIENGIDGFVLPRFKRIIDSMPSKYFIGDMPSAKEFYG